MLTNTSLGIYVHYLVWIVFREIAEHGDTWRFSTRAIESRGARCKRMGDGPICWRPMQSLTVEYIYLDRGDAVIVMLSLL